MSRIFGVRGFSAGLALALACAGASLAQQSSGDPRLQNGGNAGSQTLYGPVPGQPNRPVPRAQPAPPIPQPGAQPRPFANGPRPFPMQPPPVVQPRPQPHPQFPPYGGRPRPQPDFYPRPRAPVYYPVPQPYPVYPRIETYDAYPEVYQTYPAYRPYRVGRPRCVIRRVWVETRFGPRRVKKRICR